MVSTEQLAVNTIRICSIDAIEQAKSGHPGLPMGAAPMAYALWSRFLKQNPTNPNWVNRDRFVLSAGHGSALLYSLLHLFGFGLTTDDLRNFRQWGSVTPGHPEANHDTPGVEATTGPLGQGIANAVGMAMAEAHLAARFNREGFPILDHYTYTLCSDGDLMEGISSEAASLAGHLKLGKLIALYDSNDISLDGETSYAFSEKIEQRFTAMGWHYLEVKDENDLDAISEAIKLAQAVTDRPSIIEVRTTIGFGSQYGGTAKVHGAPLGAEEAARVRQAYKWEWEEPFYVPEQVQAHFESLKQKGITQELEWQELYQRYQAEYPELAKQLTDAITDRLPDDWAELLPTYSEGSKPVATRSASGDALQALAKKIPFFWGGSADLASSNKTLVKDAGNFGADDYRGRNIWFGVREHAMGAAMNGILLHGGLRVYGATFLVFSDYLRPAIRLAALSKLPALYIFTHDSISVGEDGPTHEPVEHVPSLRLIPNLTVFRPGDANETIAAYRYAMTHQAGPVALALSRQNLPVLGTEHLATEGVARGAYVLEDSANPDVLLVASGSEVHLITLAAEQLASAGVRARVISIPCRELFLRQPQDYQDKVLPPSISTRVVVEAAHPMGWESIAGPQGVVIGIDRFGASAPGDVVLEKYGFSVDNVVTQVKKLI